MSYLCLVDTETRVRTGLDCPNADEHEPFPRDYLSASEYADQLMQTHTQHQCDGCGRYQIWRPKTLQEETVNP